MPQEHHVLKCFSCETFQVHIVKKIPKWECKICGAKQSVKRNYGRGSGRDCRNQVMKLNQCRLSKDINLGEFFLGDDESQVVFNENRNSEVGKDDDNIENFLLEMSEKKTKETVPGNNKRVCKESNVDETNSSSGWMSEQRFSKPNKYAKYLEDEL